MIKSSFYSRNHHKFNQSKGFTLIELMVVVAIIGVVIGVISINLSRDEDRQASLEAKRFHGVVNEVRDEAIITGRNYTLNLSSKRDGSVGSYLFLGLNGVGSGAGNDALFKNRKVGNGVSLSWTIFGDFESIFLEENETKGEDENNDKSIDKKSKKKKLKKGVIFISSLGEMSSFEVVFDGRKKKFKVHLDDEGILRIKSESKI